MGAGGGVPDHLIGAASWYMTGGNERLERIVEDGFRKDEFEKIAEVLQRVNPLARRLRTFGAAANATAGGTEKKYLHIKYTPGQRDDQEDEIAALVSTSDFANFDKRRHVAFFANGSGFSRAEREALGISCGPSVQDGHPYFIDLNNPLFEPMQYVLFFPHGTGGWYGCELRKGAGGECDVVPNSGYLSKQLPGIIHSGSHMSLQRYARQMILCEPRLKVLSRLGNEYLVDMQSRIEEKRLMYIRFSPTIQKATRADLLKGDSRSAGKRVKLPASYPGGPADLRLKSQDGLALVRHYGKPTWFITMTCNPDWPEITRELQGECKGQTAWNRPDVANMVFKRKLDLVVKWIKKGNLNKTYMNDGDDEPRLHFWIHVIEFQRRGLPHAHIVVRLLPEPDPSKPEEMDACVQAEWPEAAPDASDARKKKVKMLQKLLVKRGMIHNCHEKCKSSKKCVVFVFAVAFHPLISLLQPRAVQERLPEAILRADPGRRPRLCPAPAHGGRKDQQPGASEPRALLVPGGSAAQR